MKIRAASIDTDLADVLRLITPYESMPVTLDQIRSWFLYNPPGRITLRLVSVDEKENVTGYSVINHDESDPELHFHVWLVTDPALRGQGIGCALWDACLDFLKGQGATRLAGEVGDQDVSSMDFAKQRGFKIDRHFFGSTLDLTTFDEIPYLPIIADLITQGIRFCCLADFPDDPETRRKLYDLNSTTAMDIPGVDSLPWTFDGFEEQVIKAPWFCREGQLLAVEGDTWAGMAPVSLNPETQTAYNLYTGVMPGFRGRKLAQALKVLAARYARQHGALQIRTDNDSQNLPILAINRKMGYQAQAGKYAFVRWLN